NLSPSQWWRLFWKLPILLQSRTVWYRLIHRKIPFKAILHRFIPTTHPSPACPLSLTETTEDLQHFFFTTRPLKLDAWCFTANTYTLFHLLHGIQTLSVTETTRSASLPLPELNVYQVFATSLLCIWQPHWRTVFDHVPFVTDTVNTSTVLPVLWLAWTRKSSLICEYVLTNFIVFSFPSISLPSHVFSL
ncbi:hypothetical protein FB192DRAFT_1273147, partial [Mucor lusitanicus]